MTEKKVAELEGVELDYWTAKAVDIAGIDEGRWHEGEYHWRDMVVADTTGLPGQYSPSTDWSQMGPIIQRMGMQIGTGGKLWWGCVVTNRDTPFYRAERVTMWGKVPLIAACRAIVAAKYGPTVPGEE